MRPLDLAGIAAKFDLPGEWRENLLGHPSMHQDDGRAGVLEHRLKADAEHGFFLPRPDASVRAHRDYAALRHAEEAVGEAGLIAPSNVRNHGDAVLLQVKADGTVHIGVRLLQTGGLPYHHTAIWRDDAIKFLQQRKIPTRG